VNPIIWAFLRVLVVCAFGLVPEATATSFGYLLFVLGLADLARMARTIAALRVFHRERERLEGEDWRWYGAYPVVSTLLLVAAGLSLARGWSFPPHVLAAGLVGHLIIGVRSAWDLADWLAMRQ
jgi:hypothetical protein